jgi:phenylpropionate dioxygenase-like ring-hydroxylating dioxygenase large terminal subunit
VSAPPVDPSRLEATLRPRAEASQLPREVYRSPEVLAWERTHLFEEAWVCVGREEDVPAPGDLLTTAIGDEPVLVGRDEDGGLRAFSNVCQHRGSMLVLEPAVSGAERLVCPYHGWTYGLDGGLRAAPHMAEARGFDRAACGLSPLGIGAMGGWIFVNVSGDAGSLEDYLDDFPPQLERFATGELRRVERREYDVAANWKALSENYQECYHCPSIHPELVEVTPYRSGRDEDSRGPWLGGPMDLAEGCTTMTRSGTSDRPPIPGVPEEDLRRVYYFTVLPNLWISGHPDYVMTHTVWPAAPDRTRIVCEWLFHPSQIAAPGFDPTDAVEFWDLVNGQDWAACERVQRGLAGRGFRGGRYSDMEGTIHRLAGMFARSYLTGRVARADAEGPISTRP